MPVWLKFIISAAMVVCISEVARRSSWLGGLVASLPLTSILAMLWLYSETKSVREIAQFSNSVFWLVIPSLLLFWLLPLLLRKLSFYPALGLSCLATAGAYWLMLLVLKKLNIPL